MVESLTIHIENKSRGLSRTSNTNVTGENLNQMKRFHEKLLDEIDVIICKNPSIFPRDTYYEEEVSGEEEDGQEEHDLVFHFSIPFYFYF